MSNMGYLSTLLTPETRDKAGPKNGATSMVTVNVDPLEAKLDNAQERTRLARIFEEGLDKVVGFALPLRRDRSVREEPGRSHTAHLMRVTRH